MPPIAHRRGQPSDAAVAQIEEIERHRDQQDGEEPAHHELGDEATDDDGGVGVVAELDETAEQRFERPVAPCVAPPWTDRRRLGCRTRQ